jgi:hypothetical protein
LGWHKVNARLIPFAIAFALAYVDGVKSLVARRIFVAGTFVACIAADLAMAADIRRIDRELAEAVSVSGQLQRNALILPLLLDNPQVGEIRPFTRMYDYFNLLNGGASNQSVAANYNTIVPVVYKRYPVGDYLPSMAAKDVSADSISEVMTHYDYLLVLGSEPSVLQEIEQSDLKLVAQANRVRIYSRSDSEH